MADDAFAAAAEQLLRAFTFIDADKQRQLADIIRRAVVAVADERCDQMGECMDCGSEPAPCRERAYRYIEGGSGFGERQKEATDREHGACREELLRKCGLVA